MDGNRVPLPKTPANCDWCGNATGTALTSGLRDEEGTQHLPVAFAAERFTVVQCGQCGLSYLALRPHPDDLPLYYSSEYCCFQDYRDRGRIMNLLATSMVKQKHRQLWKYTPKSTSVLLDYGCGSGTWLRMMKGLSPRFSRMIGTDITAEPIRKLAFEGIEAYTCDDTSVLEFLKPQSVGIVHLFHVIEHVPSPLHLLRTLYELLVPGGVVVGQTPNVDAWERKVCGDFWNQWHVPRHFVLFSKKTLRRHAEKAGFETVAIRDSLSSATQWSASFTKWLAAVRGAQFRGTRDPLYAPGTIAAIPLTVLQLLFGIQTSHQDFILRKPIRRNQRPLI